ncbi:MAG TPA: hypothetical protein VN325_44090 [Steroidobacteraceae bacterium]|nr:hypothetical protein [Steroidobacteraceae bacterium]
MKISLQIETHDRRVGFEIAGIGNTLSSGTLVDAPGGVKIEYRGAVGRKGLDIPLVLQFIVDASINVDLALFAAWLYDKVEGKRVERIIVRHTVITEITAETIRLAIEEEIEIEK